MFSPAESFASDFVNSAPSAPTQRDALDASVIWRVLDEIDYGLMLVTPDGQLQHANHLARFQLAQGKFIRATQSASATGYVDKRQIVNRLLRAYDAAATAYLLSGIHAAAGGRRQMLTFKQGAEQLSLACIPLFQSFEGTRGSVLLMLGRKNETANLSLGFFARSHHITPAEEAVLRALCSGQQIVDIATANGVAESTVRAQIRALREKTQCNTIRSLVQLVAALPPLVPVSLSVQTFS